MKFKDTLTLVRYRSYHKNLKTHNPIRKVLSHVCGGCGKRTTQLKNINYSRATCNLKRLFIENFLIVHMSIVQHIETSTDYFQLNKLEEHGLNRKNSNLGETKPDQRLSISATAEEVGQKVSS